MDKTLVILAAGIGSRYGAGVKQLAKMTKNGETIVDFSVYDALKAGFNKVVFIIRKEIEADFREIIGDRIEQYVDVAYAFQEVDDLPEGFENPESRTKPWGTVHALLSAKDHIDSPFLVINADDYYGKETFELMSDYLSVDRDQEPKYTLAMAGYKLKNTLSDNGVVTRGISIPDDNMKLKEIIETAGIHLDGQKLTSDLDLDESILNMDAIVSMNTWAAYPEIISYVESSFVRFLKEDHEDPLKAEYVLPTMVDQLLKENKAEVDILPTNEKWIGITYQADLKAAQEAIGSLIASDVYEPVLWEEKSE